MGSFNLSCSISGITISPGDKVVYFPLIADKFRYLKNHTNFLFGGENFCIHPTDLYGLIGLPIYGEYAGYGKLENIQIDNNVKSLAKFFNVNLKRVLDILVNGAKATELYTDGYNNYLKINKKHDLEIFTFLLTLGFKLTDKIGKENNVPLLQFEDLSFYIEPSSINNYDNHYFILYDKNLNELTYISKFRFMAHIYRDIFEHYKFYANYDIRYKKEYQDQAKVLTNSAGMYVHKDIFEYLSTEIAHEGTWSTINFKNAITLFRNQIIEFKEKILQITNKEELHLYDLFHNPWCRYGTYDNLQRYLEFIPLLRTIYKEALTEGLLFEDIQKIRNFYINSYSIGKLWGPVICGPQCGDLISSKAALEKSLELVNKMIKKRNEDMGL